MTKDAASRKTDCKSNNYHTYTNQSDDTSVGCVLKVIYRHSVPLQDINTIPGGWGYYSPMNQRTYQRDGILCEQDVPIKLSDGVTIYADIYRPEGEKNIPCILAWSIYGKRPHDMPRPWATYGVPMEAISDGTKFEGPDAYSIEMKEDLRHFFDRYLKGIYNGWELTPRVRLDVMDAYDCDIQKQRPEAEKIISGCKPAQPVI